MKLWVRPKCACALAAQKSISIGTVLEKTVCGQERVSETLCSNMFYSAILLFFISLRLSGEMVYLLLSQTAPLERRMVDHRARLRTLMGI